MSNPEPEARKQRKAQKVIGIKACYWVKVLNILEYCLRIRISACRYSISLIGLNGGQASASLVVGKRGKGLPRSSTTVGGLMKTCRRPKVFTGIINLLEIPPDRIVYLKARLD